jgi:hypothetical protein
MHSVINNAVKNVGARRERHSLRGDAAARASEPAPPGWVVR